MASQMGISAFDHVLRVVQEVPLLINNLFGLQPTNSQAKASQNATPGSANEKKSVKFSQAESEIRIVSRYIGRNDTFIPPDKEVTNEIDDGETVKEPLEHIASVNENEPMDTVLSAADPHRRLLLVPDEAQSPSEPFEADPAVTSTGGSSATLLSRPKRKRAEGSGRDDLFAKSEQDALLTDGAVLVAMQGTPAAKRPRVNAGTHAAHVSPVVNAAPTRIVSPGHVTLASTALEIRSLPFTVPAVPASNVPTITSEALPRRPVPGYETPIDVVKVFMWRARRRAAGPGQDGTRAHSAHARLPTVPCELSAFSGVKRSTSQSACGGDHAGVQVIVEDFEMFDSLPAGHAIAQAAMAIGASRLAVASASQIPIQAQSRIAAAAVARLAGTTIDLGPGSGASTRRRAIGTSGIASAAGASVSRPSVPNRGSLGQMDVPAPVASSEEMARRIMSALGQITSEKMSGATVTNTTTNDVPDRIEGKRTPRIKVFPEDDPTHTHSAPFTALVPGVTDFSLQKKITDADVTKRQQHDNFVALDSKHNENKAPAVKMETVMLLPTVKAKVELEDSQNVANSSKHNVEAFSLAAENKPYLLDINEIFDVPMNSLFIPICNRSVQWTTDINESDFERAIKSVIGN